MNDAAPSAIDIPEPLIEALASARSVAVMTGAGVSAESGIPTFRDAMTGLWARFRPEELATPEAFAANPKRVWDWYQWRRGLIAAARPNPGHLALAELETLVPDFLLATQNIDGLHAQAGSRKLVELHGSIHRVKRWDDGAPVAQWEDGGDDAPRCPQTGSLLRPDVVWFGEALPEEALSRAGEAAARCDLFLSIGASALVYPAAALIYAAMSRGAKTVEINTNDTPQSGEVSYSLRGPSGAILPRLVAAMRQRLGR